MLLMRCLDKSGQTVLSIDRYCWNWIRWRPRNEGSDVIYDELPEGETMKEGDYQGVGISARAGLSWEEYFVGPVHFGQIIIEDEQRNTRDNFRLKSYFFKTGLTTV